MDELARAGTERGEVVLQRRLDGAVELRVNGVFVMDTAETSTERRLASEALAACLDGRPAVAAPRGIRVLVGGLGLGFTLAELLGREEVAEVVVAEIEPDLVDWHRAGLVPAALGSAGVADPRVRIVVGDVAGMVRDSPDGAFDLVLLDVDNGPEHLVHDQNAALYDRAFLAACARVANPHDGVVAVWSADASPTLAATLAALFPAWSRQVDIPVRLGSRDTTYHLHLGRHQAVGRDSR